MEAKPKFSNIIDSETFGEGNRHYFIDIKKTVNNTPYLCITRSDKQDNGYKRNQLILFENDLHFFIEALTMVLGRLSACETVIN